MAQPPRSTTNHLLETGKQPLGMAGLPYGFVFSPTSRCLVDDYLVPRALRGRVPSNVLMDAVAEGVDVYSTPPEALPFPSCNRASRGRSCVDDAVWGYFFTARPAAAVSGAPRWNARDVAGGGWWYCYGSDKWYAGADGEAYAVRSRFAYYDGGGQLTQWRMKEYRLNEGAACFRGVAFHPSATNLVVWKVYNGRVEISKEQPPMECYTNDDGDENEGLPQKRMKMGASTFGSTAATGAWWRCS
jgi:hypothetical protein